MKKSTILKLFLIITIITVLGCVFSLSSSAVVLEGRCGENLTWTLDSGSGVLEIKGKGEMKIDDMSVWSNYGSQVRHLVLSSEISHIDPMVLFYMKNCQLITVRPYSDYYSVVGNCLYKKITVNKKQCYELVKACVNSYSNYANTYYPLVSIGEYAFAYNKNIESIEIAPGITEIKKGAFIHCENLESVTFPDTLTTIGGSAFGETSLKNVVLPESLTTIDEGAFAFCRQLESIEIPDTVTHIGNGAFGYTRNLKSFRIPKGVSKLSNELFVAAGITEIEIPENIKEIGEYTFNGCPNLKNVKILNDDLVLGPHCFAECVDLENINLPKNLTVIPRWCFSVCNDMKNIVIPESVTTIEENAFAYCSSLESLHFGKNLNSIDATAFTKINCFPTISKDNPVYYTESNCIIDRTTKTLVYGNEQSLIPSDGSVERIGNSAFIYCIDLKSIVIPDNVVSIGNSAFMGCENLENITLPKQLKSIGSLAFSDCNLLNNVQLPQGIESIDYLAFSNCDSLTSIVLPDSLKTSELGRSIFFYCRSLESATLPSTLTEIPQSIFSECINLKSINIPHGVTVINERAFDTCISLESIEFPQGLTAIGNRAFYRCKLLKEITIPAKVTSIGDNAFKDCYGLETVIFEGCPEFSPINVFYASKQLSVPRTAYLKSPELIKRFNTEPLFVSGVFKNVAVISNAMDKDVFNPIYTDSKQQVKFKNDDYALFTIKDWAYENNYYFVDETGHYDYNGKLIEHTFNYCYNKCDSCNYTRDTTKFRYDLDIHKHWKYCTLCPFNHHTFDAELHELDEGEIVSLKLNDGNNNAEYVDHIKYTCTVCGYIQYELYEPTTPEPTVTPTPEPTVTPEDTSITPEPTPTPTPKPSVTPEDTDTTPVTDVTPENTDITPVTDITPEDTSAHVTPDIQKDPIDETVHTNKVLIIVAIVVGVLLMALAFILVFPMLFKRKR